MTIRKNVLTVFFSLFVSGTFAQTDSITVRVKGMRCEECAHKVMVAVKQLPGIESVRSNIERRTTTVVFDRLQTSKDSIEARLAATKRYKASPYSPTDTIRRGMGLRMDDMHCQNCANRIAKKLQAMEGIDSMAPHLDKHYYFIRYDANRTCKADIKEALLGLGFTPVNYYSGPKVNYAYFNIPKEQATQATADEVLIMDGVEDVCVNARRGSLAVTFFTDETTADKLLADIVAAGVKAQVPPPHECKEGGANAE